MKSTTNIFISLVWLINGLFCKLLNIVPRHQEIVASILGKDHDLLFTKIIGILEVLMFTWIISGIRSKTCAITQIIVILLMNCIEFYIVPDLLLFGKLNLLVALVFTSFIYLNQFGFHKLRAQ